jgi:hypothetical protein
VKKAIAITRLPDNASTAENKVASTGSHLQRVASPTIVDPGILVLLPLFSKVRA